MLPAGWARFDSGGWRPFALYILFLLLVLAVHGSRIDMPFYADSMGYIIYTTRYMLAEATIFQPIAHDTGHPPLGFLALGTAWSIFGRSLAVSHLVQYAWMALLLLAVWSLGRAMAPRRIAPAVLAVLVFLLHPVYFVTANTLDLEVPQMAFLAWAINGVYTRRRAVMILGLVGMLYAKASSIPSAFFLCVVEFVLLPMLAALWNRDRPGAAALMWAWWRMWVSGAMIAALCIGMWLVVHRVHSGFWLQSPQFTITTRMEWTWEQFQRGFQHVNVWNVWWREGTREWVGLCVFLLVLAIVQARISSIPYRRVFRPRGGFLRPLPMFCVSMLLQALMFYCLYAFKVEILGRYFMPFSLFLMLAGVAAYAMLLEAMLPTKGGRAFSTRVTAWGVLVILAGNWAIRIHPSIPTRIPFLAVDGQHYLMNWQEPTSELGAQFFELIDAHKRAIRWLDRERGDGDPIVAAWYPYNPMLLYPEAGYVDRPFRVFSPDTDEKLLGGEWDYLYQAPVSLAPRLYAEGDEFMRTRGAIEVRRVLPREQGYQTYPVTILRATLLPPQVMP